MSDNHFAAEQDCEYLKGCAVWTRFHTDSKFVWIKSYCQGSRKDQCARKLQKTQREFVPDELLPNGSYLNAEGVAPNACENLPGCAVWKRFQTDSKMVWIRAYCQGPRRNSCARKLWQADGQSVPDTLLPNGAIL